MGQIYFGVDTYPLGLDRMDSQLPIRNLDYAVIFARRMPEMCDFYEKTLGF